MKHLFSVILAAVVSLSFSACSTSSISGNSAAVQTNRPVRLQLSVNIPASMNLIRDDDISEAFAYRVSSALHEQGLKGRIHYVDAGDRIDPSTPTLEVILHEWRVDPLGNVNCVFSANLKNGAGSASLGVFSGTSMMMWSHRDWLARQDGFEDAASDALNNLGARIIKSGLVPDLAPR